MTVPDRRLVTDALVAMIAGSTGKPCGKTRVPDLPAVTPPAKPSPYTVVHAIDGGGFWGPGLVAPEESADFVYQVDSVGWSPDQCEWMADAVRRTLLARTSSGAFQVAFPAVSGLVVTDRRPEGGPGGIDAGGKRPNEVYSIAERFTVCVCPA